MSETLLQKDFAEKDLQRIRNLATKKFSEKTTTQVGYKKVREIHNEGEIFTEDGKQWTIKNGIKTTFSKLDLVKKSLQSPFTCPQCSHVMKHNLDKKFYFIHKKCFDCVIKYETQLRLDGKFEEYAQGLIRANATSFINDLEQEFADFLTQGIQSYVTEQGDMEDWGGAENKKKQIAQEFQEYIESIRSILKN